MGVVKIRREANRILQQFDGIFQLPSFLLLYRFFIFLDGFLRKVLLHLADVDLIAIFAIQSREAGARIRSRFTDKDRDVRGAEVVEHLDLLPRRFITVGCYGDEIRTGSEIAKFKTTAAVGIRDRKSTRLNSSHQIISYAVF